MTGSEGPWPNDRLEKEMLADADLLGRLFPEGTAPGNDAACHIRALLGRVRELEADLRNQRKRHGELFLQDLHLLEQFAVATDRAEAWKNLCTHYKELAEARGEKLDMDRDFERRRR